MNVVRYIGESESLPSDYLRCFEPDSGWVIYNSLPPGANVVVRFELDGRPLEIDFDSLTRDFLDLATLVYIADEINVRRQASNQWTRRFNVLFPVRNPDLWSANQKLLYSVLETLAGDHYEFTWIPRPKLHNFGNHREKMPKGYDTVCLFSGGIDSFMGAYKLLSEGKKVLFVGHQAEGTAASAQTQLIEFLRREFPDRCALVQCRVARSTKDVIIYDLPSNDEDTHRTRSLLFLGLAIGVARAAEIDQVYIPENGLIALNPPLGKSRLGTLSTRTVHPKYLTELCDFLNVTGIFQGSIKNPFLFSSKTDMLVGIDPKLSDALKRSVSCARPYLYKHLGVRHCGYCVPCIYRRTAMMSAGLDASTDYAYQIFEGMPDAEVVKQIDFRSLFAFAKKVVSATPLGRELIALSHGSFPLSAGERFGGKPVQNYDIWGEMLFRWATDFLGKIDKVGSVRTKKALGFRSV
ncbi:MAG TPA: Qat anti-phage system QueC-like protein QatC [Verrucomicrobiae bacterium]